MQSWLSRLEPRTNNHDNKCASDLVYAFDNNQRLQKVWLSRNSNKQTQEVMTNVIKLELKVYYFQKSTQFHPQTWRNYEKIKSFDEHFFSTKKENIESLRKGFETVLCFDETDQIQHKISANELKAQPIYCKQCNKVFDKKKIKCDENQRHGTSLFEPISTRIVPQKNEKQVKSTN